MLSLRLTGRAVVAAGVLLAAASPGPACGDWLVTRDGQLIETLGPWRIEGGQVVFESRSIPVSGKISGSDTRFTVSVDLIDLARSASETRARSGGGREVPAVAAAAPWTMLRALEDWGYPDRAPDRLELVLKLGGAAWDNFLQDPETDPRQEVAAGFAEARLTWRLFGRFKSYVEAGHIRYDHEEVPATTGYEAGLRLDGAHHGFQAGARWEPGRRAPELDDAAEIADIRKYRARYFGHRGALDWSLGGERIEQRFEERPGRASTAHRARVTLVYRGLRGRLVPEAAFGLALRDATEDERERTLQLGLRSRPLSPLSLAVRFESTQRRFLVTDAGASNFRRQDTRRRWILEGEINLTRQLAFSLQYSLLQGDSTRADRRFTAQNAAAGLTVTLGSTRGELDRRPRRPRPGRPLPAVHAAPPAAETGSPASVTVSAPWPAAPGERSSAGAAPSKAAPAPMPAASPPPPEPPRAAAPAAPAASTLLDVRAGSGDGETTITLHGDGELRYSTLTLATPHRFVLDLPGVAVGSSRTIVVGSDLVRSVRVAQFQPGPSPVGRVVVDLEPDARVQVERRDGSLRIRVRPGG